MTPAALTRARRIALAAVSLGVVVMVVFDAWYTLLAGIVLMLGAVVAGTFLVALPGGFLDHDAPEEAGGGPGAGGPSPAEQGEPGGPSTGIPGDPAGSAPRPVGGPAGDDLPGP